MSETLTAVFTQYGYAVLFVGVLLENLGVPVPGETALLAAGFLAQQGVLHLPSVIGIAIVAAVLGDNLGYWVGRRAGRPLVERYGRLVGLTPARLAALYAFFHRHGAWTIFLARFVAGLRVFAALVAGMSRLPWRQFVVYNVAGAIAWATAIGLAGYVFGQSWPLLERWVGRAGIFLAGLVVGLALLVAAFRRYGPRLAATADARLPAAFGRREVALVTGSLGAIGLFAKIAEDVVDHESTDFDHAVAVTLHRLTSPALDLVMQGLTLAGSFPVLLALSLLVVAHAARLRDRRGGAALAAVAVAAEVLNAALKFAFHRARPTLWAAVQLHTYSFPSGHAMAASAVYGMAAVVLARLHPRLRRPLALVTPLLILLIGLSRVYLGVHWPTDVLAGFAAGTFVVLAGVALLEAGGGAPDARGGPSRRSPGV